MDRGKLTVDLRRRLYTLTESGVKGMAKEMDIRVDGSTMDELMASMEEKIDLSVKEEDGGVELLKSLIDKAKNVKSPSVVAVDAGSGVKTDGTPPPAWRKEFKISGQIGDCSGSLSYLSFLRQVNGGQTRGYTEGELVDGIIRAMAPGSKLRGYLEGSSDLSLARIQKVVRTFYKEPSATELFQQLCTLAQTGKETPHEFIFRALELRQKIFFADRENATKYDKALVVEQFNQAVATGLRDDNLRIEPGLEL